MALDKTSESGASGFLSGLLTPLRLPERGVEALIDAAGALREVRSELSAMRAQTEPLGELVPLTKELKALIVPLPPTVERISAQAQPLDQMLPALERVRSVGLVLPHRFWPRCARRVDRLGDHAIPLVFGQGGSFALDLTTKQRL